MLKTCIATLFSFISLLSYSQDTQDYKITSYQISLTKATDEAIDAINNSEKKEEKKIVIEKTCSQADFSKACKAFPWITKLETSYGNELINDISAMKSMQNLTEVTFKSLRATRQKPLDLNALKGAKGLKKLDCYTTKVINTEALANLTELEDVSFYMSGVSSIDFVKNTPKLKRLNLYGTDHTFSNYEPLTSLKNLSELNVYMNPQATDENLEVLKSLTSLTKIYMANCKDVTTLDFLANSKGMMEIHASWCDKLDDFSVLKDMQKLKVLEISDSQISSVDFLKDNHWITVLDISDTQVKDISPLKNCTSLNTLKVSGLPVDDISFVNNFPNVWSLEVPSTVPQSQIDAIKETHEHVNVRVED